MRRDCDDDTITAKRAPASASTGGPPTTPDPDTMVPTPLPTATPEDPCLNVDCPAGQSCLGGLCVVDQQSSGGCSTGGDDPGTRQPRRHGTATAGHLDAAAAGNSSGRGSAAARRWTAGSLDRRDPALPDPGAALGAASGDMPRDYTSTDQIRAARSRSPPCAGRSPPARRCAPGRRGGSSPA